MVTNIQLTPEIAEELVNLYTSDKDVQSEGEFEAFSILSYFSDSMIRTLSSSYRSGEPAINCSIDNIARRRIHNIIQNTWLDNQDRQPETPVAAIIVFDRQYTELSISYFTGPDSEQWSVDQIDADELRERLRPESVERPS